MEFDIAFEQGVQTLRKAGMRITEPRKALLNRLVAAPHPIAAEELHSQLGARDFDLVTVYRNLEAFAKIGVVHKLMTESGKALFEFKVDKGHHHHILCRECHQAECLEGCELGNLEQLAKQLGYSDVTHVLELYGVCAHCREQQGVR